MTNADELFAVAADCWGYLETERVDGWELRAGVGFTHRANSVWPLGPLSRGLPEALASVSAWYAGRELPPLVQAVVGSELDGRREAKGDVIRHLLREHDLPPERSVMVGDRSHDVAGARENGIPCVGVLYGYGSREELLTAGAASLAATPAEVADAAIECQRSGVMPKTSMS